MVFIGLRCGTNLPQVTQADELTAQYGTRDCRRFRQHIFSDLSPIAIDLALRYARTAERLSYDKAFWIPALKKAGLKYRNPYQTRHTFASTLLSRGENQLWITQQMGHKDWGTNS
jgi:integrase